MQSPNKKIHVSSAIGFPSIPVIKIATNGNTYRRMRDNMDINAGVIADGEQSIQEVGREIFDNGIEGGVGRANLRRAAGAQGICAAADWAGAVERFSNSARTCKFPTARF